MKICSVEGCERKHIAKGFCNPHYLKWRRYGNPLRSVRLCDVEDCENPPKAKGFCKRHYQKWRKYGDPLQGWTARVCEIEGCERKHRAKGFCERHYLKWRRYGNPLQGRQAKPVRLCDVEDCENPHKAKGFCKPHYNQLYRQNNPDKRKAEKHRRRARLQEVPTSPHLDFDIAILEFFQDNCMKCGSKDNLSIDHIIPISWGGSNELSNFQRLCMSCNRSKNANYADYRPTWMRV